MPINKDHWYDGWFYDTWIATTDMRLLLEFKGTPWTSHLVVLQAKQNTYGS